MNMSFSQTDTNHRSKAKEIVLAETESAVHSTSETVCCVVLCCVENKSQKDCELGNACI